MKQVNKQEVFFKDTAGNWFRNLVDLKDVYMRVHSAGTKYGSSADMLLSEMMANVLELIREGKVSLEKGLIITDYGCGRSKAANVVGKTLASNAKAISLMFAKGENLKTVMAFVAPLLKAENAIEVSGLNQVETYGTGTVTVQRFDIGIPEFSKTLENRADVVFCNDVFEHIPAVDLPAFIEALESTGKYIFASISLRDAVNYSPLEEALLKKGAQRVQDVPKNAIVLEKDACGAYIFSLHVSVFPKSEWQKILGSRWHLLPAQDYTACSAINFEPSDDYQAYKKDLIASVGFADFIAFPTPVGTRYESDPILFRRVAKMQPAKHVMKLKALEEYPDSAFKRSETAKSQAFLAFIGVKDRQLSSLPQDYLEKLYELERQSKAGELKNNQLIAQRAEMLISGKLI